MARAQEKMPAPPQVNLPDGGRVVVKSGDLSGVAVGLANGGVSEIVKVNGPGFERAIRAVSTGRGRSWDLEVRVPMNLKINKGDVVSMRVWVRAPETRDESGQGLMEVNVGTTGAPWGTEFWRNF